MAEVVTSKAAMKLAVATKPIVEPAMTTKTTVARGPTVATGAAMTSPTVTSTYAVTGGLAG